MGDRFSYRSSMNGGHTNKQWKPKKKPMNVRQIKEGEEEREIYQKRSRVRKQQKLASETEEIAELNKNKSILQKLVPDDINSFAKFPLSKYTLEGLKENDYTVPTKVQRQSLVYSLRGMDVVAAAKTGSGKTLAFIIPLLECLYRKRWTQLDGLGAVVITPTRELAYQIFEVLRRVGKKHNLSAGLIIGGKDLKYEWSLIGSCNILICTPGRLLHHMSENPSYNGENIQMLILDEADQCLSMGFARDMNSILEEFPRERQTLLFSATQTRDLKDLIRAGCQDPVFCSAHEHSKTATPRGLKESYCVLEAHDKFKFLWSFVKYHKKKKILVFLSTCKQVKYIHDVFTKLNPGMTVLCLNGDMNQLRRMAVYDIFCKKDASVLFATDVAARGLDIPAVDWVVQADCCEDVNTYIHRVGRTARYADQGEAVLVLTSSEEEPMLAKLALKNIKPEKMDIDPSKILSVQIKLEIALTKYNELKETAVRAFKMYIKSVALMKDKKVFNVMSIDFDAFARSLGLIVTPRLRFLQKQQKLKSQMKEKESQSEDGNLESEEPLRKTTMNFGSDIIEDDDDDEFLTSSKKRLGAEKQESEEPPLEKFVPRVNPKKLLARNDFAYRTKIVFKDDDDNKEEEEGEEEVKNEETTGDEKKDQGASGINITEVQEKMKVEDKIDRKLAAERRKEKRVLLRKKEKGEDDEAEFCGDESDESEYGEETQRFVDLLPDPDKIFSRKDGDNESDDDGVNTPRKRKASSDEESSSEDSDEESEDSDKESEDSDEEVHDKKKMKLSAKKLSHIKLKEAKRARSAQEDTISDLPVDEKEQLALFLLRGGK